MAEIVGFPKDGERFWRVFEPALREWLIERVSQETADAVLADVAPIARGAADTAFRLPAKPAQSTSEAVNAWLRSVVYGVLAGTAALGVELHQLRAERDRLLTQLRSPRPV